jgi:hypothetical protein
MKQKLPQMKDISLVDFFELSKSDKNIQYVATFRANGELYRNRIKEYEDNLSHDIHYEVSFSIKYEDNSESKHVGVLQLPKVKRNAVGTIVAEIIYMIFPSKIQIKADRNISILDIRFIKELSEPPNASYLDNILSLQ